AGVNVLLAPLVGAAQESAAAALGQRTLEGEFKAGKEMSREAALALALGETRSVALKGTSADGQDLLGKREADVAKLVAEGMTNKEIGSRLFISERTVESHVRNILNKLGFNSRAQIASWVGSNRSKDRAPGDALDV
ncbi:MAG TPA: helix-turn-helix transcriptional regulator, partial [Candidatus Dormibacteraeota bacterium]|nr:helix-turn-helix transcriptional regulator [Candidatus Dormibacteraeota bacterium]